MDIILAKIETTMPGETMPTPEKSAEEIYIDALQKKRDTVLAFHTMNSFRKNRKVADMSPDEMEDYRVLKEDWQSKKEFSFSAFENLSAQEQDEFSAMGMRLYEIQAKLTLLTKEDKDEAVTEEESSVLPQPPVPAPMAEPKAVPAPLAPERDFAGEARIRPEVQGENIALEAINDEIQKAEERVKYAQDTGRVPGVGPDGLSLAQKELDDLKAKRELLLKRMAEGTAVPQDAQPERPSVLRPEKGLALTLEREKAFSENSKVGLGQDIKDTAGRAYESAKSGISNSWASLKSKYRVAKEYVKDETKGLGGWLKERGKGLASFGIWEFHQAEKFRSKTREAAGDVQALSTLIQGEQNLNPEEAEAEAWEIMNKLKAEGIATSGAPEFLEVSKDITLRKAKENGDEIEYIIKTAKEELREKLGVGKGAFKEYKGEAGEKMLTPENEKRFEDALRMELNKLRIRQGADDVAGFAKLMRNNLDSNWQWRYVWGAAEAALGFIGVKFLVMNIEKAALAKLAAAEQASAAGTGAAEQVLTQAMNENVWNTLREMAQKNGINLNPAELKELSQKVLDFNGMFEKEWIDGAVEGLRSSRSLPQGFLIKIPAEVLPFLGF